MLSLLTFGYNRFTGSAAAERNQSAGGKLCTYVISAAGSMIRRSAIRLRTSLPELRSRISRIHGNARNAAPRKISSARCNTFLPASAGFFFARFPDTKKAGPKSRANHIKLLSVPLFQHPCGSDNRRYPWPLPCPRPSRG